ncbi:hypothetical protein ACHAXR_008047 [Thalassiosira sp. AJA248-18]
MAIAATLLLIAIGGLGGSAVAEASAEKTTTCSMTGDNSAAFSSTKTDEHLDTPDESDGGDDDYQAHCYIWPATGVPPEHQNTACNRAVQNAVWAADDAVAHATPPEDLIPDTVYLNMPEEKSWVCPLDTTEEAVVNNGGGNNNLINVNAKGNTYAGATTGHPTRWILHNEATTPIVLTHLNALGLEVSAMDFSTYPAHANTAVYPNGPIVLPGQLAVVEGRQGQLFIAREYKEVTPMDAMADDTADGNHHHSWSSFKSVLPSTLSFLPQQTRYETNKGVWHVLGSPGRVLMKHRMGNIYVKNQFGAVCPELMGGGSGGGGGDVGLSGNPKDMDPDCNVMRKAFINKVGCPIDIYFAPQNKVEGYNCETFTKHLGPLDPFLLSDTTTRDIDGHNSPLKFENTYNGHSFVARMSHDQTLVARIELDHDVVKDCPEPNKRGGAGVEVRVDERLLQGVPMPVNASESSNAWFVSAKVNATTAAPVLSGKPRQEKHDLLWHNNHTGIISASVPIAS